MPDLSFTNPIESLDIKKLVRQLRAKLAHVARPISELLLLTLASVRVSAPSHSP